jgi:hypothetical protein
MNGTRKMTSILAQAELHPLKTDPACYIGSEIRIASHVDDYLITASSDQILEIFMTNLEKASDVDKRGIPRKFLGIECTLKTEIKEWNRRRNNRQTISSMHLTQTKIIEALCEQCSVLYRASTPCRSDADLSITRPTEDETVNPTAYQSIIGSLSYISQMTRPDIMFIISKLAQRNVNLAKRHWEATIRVLQYLYGTKDYSHTIRAGSSQRVTIYVDTSYDLGENGRSQTGTVTLSSTEAEYIAMTVAAQEAAWLKMLLEEIGEKKIIPVVVTDNEGAKRLTENPISHRRTKHIQIRFHYIREQLKEGKLEVK